jgi:hypothetical protein
MNKITAEFVMEKLAQDVPFQQTRINTKYEDKTKAPGYQRVAFSGGFPNKTVSQRIMFSGNGERTYEPIEKGYAFTMQPHEDKPESPNMAWNRAVMDMKPSGGTVQPRVPSIQDSKKYQVVKNWSRPKDQNVDISSSIASRFGGGR